MQSHSQKYLRLYRTDTVKVLIFQRHSHLVFIQCPCFKSAVFCTLTNSSQYHYTIIWSCCRAGGNWEHWELGTVNSLMVCDEVAVCRKISLPKKDFPRACEVPCLALFSCVNSQRQNRTPPGDFRNTNQSAGMFQFTH